jgi:hypothetical protein
MNVLPHVASAHRSHECLAARCQRTSNLASERRRREFNQMSESLFRRLCLLSPREAYTKATLEARSRNVVVACAAAFGEVLRTSLFLLDPPKVNLSCFRAGLFDRLLFKKHERSRLLAGQIGIWKLPPGYRLVFLTPLPSNGAGDALLRAASKSAFSIATMCAPLSM